LLAISILLRLKAIPQGGPLQWGRINNQDEPPIGKCLSIGIEDGKLKAIVQFLSADYPVYGPKGRGHLPHVL
jgi:hypothetical protein